MGILLKLSSQSRENPKSTTIELNRKECICEQCAWWYEAVSEEDSDCVIALLPERLDAIGEDIVNELEGVKNDIYDRLGDVVVEVSGVSATIDSHKG